ncbi:phosphatase domain-containing protein [Brevibacterium oceani]|uniref:phosphatase domain-containing protein n=1 Tax=Brevibacterium oceani TaxID=358099 RepID=UPI0015E6E273|nr:HAD family acid phosphatase [Brevibacterium oceani]
MTDSLIEAVVVDVDGTLCDVSGIRHYVVDPDRRNFDKFHRASALCPPISETIEWVEDHRRRGRAIIVVTARQRTYESITRTWLRKWEVPFDALLMRATRDQRPDRDVKRDILASIRAEGFDVVAAIDDNPGVIALWESESIPVTVVPGWDDPIAIP